MFEKKIEALNYLGKTKQYLNKYSNLKLLKKMIKKLFKITVNNYCTVEK